MLYCLVTTLVTVMVILYKIYETSIRLVLYISHERTTHLRFVVLVHKLQDFIWYVSGNWLAYMDLMSSFHCGWFHC